MRVTQRMIMDNLQRNIGTSGETLARLQEQIASSKRIRRPSDDPQAVSRALALRATSQQNAQCLRNIASAKDWLGATGAALDQLSDLLSKARDLALRGATDSLGVEERKALGKQVDTYLGEALQVVNSQNEGKYIFAGFRTDSAPFAAGGSFTQAPSGPVGDIRREIRPGFEMVINLRGNTVIDGEMPLQNTLTVLINLRDQLNAGSSSASLVAGLDSCHDGVVAMQGFVGASFNRLDATEKALDDDQIEVAAQLSREEDTDTLEATIRLKSQETVYTAALNTASRVLQLSLLDFLR